jgi:GNAT superfamily N-acetyltransferase
VSDVRIADLPRAATTEAVAVLANGMRDNPIHVAAYGPDAGRRERCHGRLMRALLRSPQAPAMLGAWQGDRLVGCAGVAHGGDCRPGPAAIASMLPALVALGPATALRVRTWTSAWRAADPDEPHAHIGPVAVARDVQGTGIGTLLLAELCRRLDTEGHTAYLETDRPENVRFYKRAGFTTVAEALVLGVPCWYMRRSPDRRLAVP